MYIIHPMLSDALGGPVRRIHLDLRSKVKGKDRPS